MKITNKNVAKVFKEASAAIKKVDNEEMKFNREPKTDYRRFKETYEFRFKGKSVWVKIDYVNNKISLVEPFNKPRGEFQPKKWDFSGRGIEYMNGWLNILEAMQEAVKDAQVRYNTIRQINDQKEEIELAHLMQMEK